MISGLRFSMRSISFIFILGNAVGQGPGGEWNTWHIPGSGSGAELGHSVASLGDIDGDGFEDIIAGSPRNYVAGLTQAGSAFVYSGATGNVIFQLNGEYTHGEFGYSVSGGGDIDGDGVPDFMVGARLASPNGMMFAGSAYTFSGATGALIWRLDGEEEGHYFGHSVADAGDVNGDGFDDILVGAPSADSGSSMLIGKAYVFSGATGALLFDFNGHYIGSNFGNAVDGLGDVNADGYGDFIVGSEYQFVSQGSEGAAYVYSGRDGSMLWQQYGPEAWATFGSSVSGVGDIDGDGRNDFIVGALGTHHGWAYSSSGSAFVFSGASGNLLFRFDAFGDGHLFGASVSGGADVNGDCVVDLVVGAPGSFVGPDYAPSYVSIFSSETGQLIERFWGSADNDRFGFSVSSAGDLDGNGLSDVIAGAPWESNGPSSLDGGVYSFALDPFLNLSATELSISSGATVALELDFPPSENNAAYIVLASLSKTPTTTLAGLEIPLTDDWLFYQIASGNAPAPLQGAYGVLNGAGQASASITAGPSMSSAVGKTLYLAAVTYGKPPLNGRMSSISRKLLVLP